MTAQDPPAGRMSSGVPGLDTILSGGFFQGGLYLLQGTPGTGKTTIANQICFHAVRNGGRALYVTLLAEYHMRMVQHLRPMSFFDEARIPDGMRYVSGFQTLRSEGLSALSSLIRREILSSKVSVLIVDGIFAAQRAATSDQSFNEFIHELQGIASLATCTVFLVASAKGRHHAGPEHTMVDGIVEMSDQERGWATERVLQVIKIRGSDSLRGQHAYKITDDGVVVFPRIEALLATPTRADPPDAGKVTSGCAALDAMLGGGLPGGSPTMLVGPSGVGKTTFGLHFLSGCGRDEPGLMFGFYETPSRIIAKAHQVCRPLLKLLEEKSVRLLWEAPIGESPDAYAERLLSAVRRGGVRRLFLDGLGAFQNAGVGGGRALQYLPALTGELRALGVTTVYSLEMRDLWGPALPLALGDFSLLAENMVLLRYVEVGASLHRLISIVKVRDSDFDTRSHEFFLTGDGPEIVQSTHSAEALMSGFAPRDATPRTPGVE